MRGRFSTRDLPHPCENRRKRLIRNLCTVGQSVSVFGEGGGASFLKLLATQTIRGGDPCRIRSIEKQVGRKQTTRLPGDRADRRLNRLAVSRPLALCPSCLFPCLCFAVS